MYFLLLLGAVQSALDYQFSDNLCLDSSVVSFVLTFLLVAYLPFLLHANLVVSVVCVVFFMAPLMLGLSAGSLEPGALPAISSQGL